MKIQVFKDLVKEEFGIEENDKLGLADHNT